MAATAAPSPDVASASAAARVGHEDWEPRPARRASYRSLGPAAVPPATARGRLWLAPMRSSREAVGSPAGRQGQLALPEHQVMNNCSSASRLSAWSVA